MEGKKTFFPRHGSPQKVFPPLEEQDLIFAGKDSPFVM